MQTHIIQYHLNVKSNEYDKLVSMTKIEADFTDAENKGYQWEEGKGKAKRYKPLGMKKATRVYYTTWGLCQYFMIT